ncbi:MAG TPA: hypothetical protein VHT30_08345 [Acidimicrobiales bacterium]|nr:hypothetical protein [Acidimicrobiales bacterium]
MSAGALAVAVACVCVFLASGAAVAVAVKRRLFGDWTGSDAVVVYAAVWICWALGLGQLLGAVGVLRRGALVAAALASAAIAFAATRAEWRPIAASMPISDARTSKIGIEEDHPATTRPQEPTGAPEPIGAPARAGRLALIAATALLVGVVAAIWVARTAIAVHRGINDPDSLGYHLPFAVTFAQSGYADQHRYVLPYLPVHFYPANDELLVGMAVALSHSVAFAAVKNLVYGSLVLVAAHSIGRVYRAGAAAVAGAALVLGVPVIAFSQPGEAVNDTLLVLVLVAGLALVARAGRRPAAYVMAGACAGVAAGIKFSGLWPAAGLGALVVVLACVRLRSGRLATIGAATLGAVALGGSWYLRNVVTYANPVPPANIHLGPWQLRQIPTAAGPKSYTVLHFLVHGQLLAQFRHGLRLGLGPLVVLLLAVWLVGAVACLVRGDAFVRGLGVLALVCAFGYLATPASAWGLIGPGHNLGAFVINLHYAATALIVGVIGFGVWTGRSVVAALLPGLGIAVALTGIKTGEHISFWSPQMGAAGFWVLVAAGAVAAAAVAVGSLSPALTATTRRAGPGARPAPAASQVAAASPRRTPSVMVAASLAAVALVAVVLGVAVVARRYPSQEKTDPVEAWADRVSGVRLAAWVPDVALLYGRGGTNRVVTLTQLAQHAPIPLSSCPAWKEAVTIGRFGYSAVLPGTVWKQWLAHDPAFRLVVSDPVVAVYQVVGQPDISCPGQT